MDALPPGGAMTAVFAAEPQLRSRLGRFGGRVSIAALNAPDSAVVSGDAEAVRQLAGELTQEGIVCRPLTVSHAFHSSLMEPMLDEFEALLRTLRFSAPQLGLISNVTGRLMPPDEIPDAAYWRRHVREAVRFSDGMRTLVEQGCSVFLEIGPTPTLTSLGRRCLPDTEALWAGSLRRDDEWGQLLSSVARLYAHGVDLDWRGFDRDYRRRTIALPTYPFERQRYWVDAEKVSRGALARRRGRPSGARSRGSIRRAERSSSRGASARRRSRS